MMTAAPSGYLETPAVLKLAKIPYSTLDYWVRTGLIVPSIRTGSGRRRPRQWSVSDAVAVRALKQLRDAGAPVRLLAKARVRLQEDWAPSLTTQMLFWDGADLLYLDEWENLRSLIKEPGQSALHVVALPLSLFASEAAAAVVVQLAAPSDRVASRAVNVGAAQLQEMDRPLEQKGTG